MSESTTPKPKLKRMIKMNESMAVSFSKLLNKVEDIIGRPPDKAELLEACYDPEGGIEYANAHLKPKFTPKHRRSKGPW